MVQKEIRIEIIDGFIEYNNDMTQVLSEADSGEVFTAVFNEDSKEYFAKDKQGRKFLVGDLGFNNEPVLEVGMKLL